MKPLYIKKNGTVHKVAGVGMPSVYPAGNVSYDNTTSGLTADDAQSAIDELVGSVADKVDKVNGKGLSTNDYDNTAKALVDGLTEALGTKADKDGSYSTLTAGKILVNNNLLQTDKTPFLTRQTLNPTGFSGYVRDKLVGASYAWNQQIDDTQFTDFTSGLTATLSNHKLAITGTTTTGSNYRFATSKTLYAGHKYAIFGIKKFTSSNADYGKIFVYNAQTSVLCTLSPDNQSEIFNVTTTAEYNIYLNVGTSGITINFEAYMQLVDLTLAFGSTIADYLYGLSNNGGITKLRDMGFPIDSYTAYGYNLVSSKTSAKKVVGKNICDEVFEVGGIDNSTGQNNDSDTSQCRMANYVSVLPNTSYLFSCGYGTGIRIYWYDANKTFISSFAVTNKTNTSPSNARYLRIRSTGAYGNSYRHDMLVAIHYSGMDTTYEPYSETTYSLGNDELRGKFDLVNGEIVASGDVKESNGNVQRVRGRQNLGDLPWGNFSTNVFRAALSSDIAKVGGVLVSERYVWVADYNSVINTDKTITYIVAGGSSYVFVHDSAYSDYSTFKTAMSGVYMEYELATPTTEQSSPFADPMSLVGATTEEYIDTRDIPCPVGHETGYYGIGTEGFSMPPAPENMDDIYKLYYSKNGYGFIPDDFKSKTFSYKYTGATVADTQYNVQNAKANVFGLESKDIIIGMSIYMSMGDTACNFSTPVYNKNSDMFIFKPTDSNATYLTFDGVVFYR